MISGPELFCLYAQPPNLLGYCGPDDNQVVSAATAGVSVPRDELLRAALAFHGAFPYLEVIAAAARLDPLDREVVEAYWIGGPLLDAVGVSAWGNSVQDRFRPRAGARWGSVAEAVNGGGLPNHAFHVFAVYPWVGLLREGHTRPALEVLDKCRISWGRVLEVTGSRATVSRRSLRWTGEGLALGPECADVFAVPTLLGALAVGEWVSLHWNGVCDRLRQGDVRRLRAAHHQHLALANQELAARRLEPA